MKLSVALRTVEDALTALRLSDEGIPLEGLMAIGQVSSVDPSAWEAIESELRSAKPEEIETAAERYCERALDLIEKFKKHRFRDEIEDVFAELMAKQEGRKYEPRPRVVRQDGGKTNAVVVPAPRTAAELFG